MLLSHRNPAQPDVTPRPQAEETLSASSIQSKGQEESLPLTFYVVDRNYFLGALTRCCDLSWLTVRLLFALMLET